MPIFEFRCLGCGETFEKLFMRAEDKVDIACPECKAESCERVVSSTSYVMGSGPGGKKGKLTTKSCGPSNKCMTLDLPGPAK
jgi:putative FmdB family regulatory protein